MSIGVVERINRDERTATVRTASGGSIDALYFGEPPPPMFGVHYVVDSDGAYVLGSRARIEVLAHDDFAVLGSLAAIKSATVAARETTTSVTYADLATVGPSVSLVTGTSVIITIDAQMLNSGVGYTAAAVDVSGATTIAAIDANCVAKSGTNDTHGSRRFELGGLTRGLNIFTLKYRVTSGTGTVERRDITVDRP